MNKPPAGEGGVSSCRCAFVRSRAGNCVRECNAAGSGAIVNAWHGLQSSRMGRQADGEGRAPIRKTLTRRVKAGPFLQYLQRALPLVLKSLINYLDLTTHRVTAIQTAAKLSAEPPSPTTPATQSPPRTPPPVHAWNTSQLPIVMLRTQRTS